MRGVPRRHLQAYGLLLAGVLCSGASSAQEQAALDCVINPHRVFDLGSAVSGVLAKVNVDRSDYVEAGQVLAELDTDVERASMAVALAHAENQSELNLSRLNVTFDQRRLVRRV